MFKFFIMELNYLNGKRGHSNLVRNRRLISIFIMIVLMVGTVPLNGAAAWLEKQAPAAGAFVYESGDSQLPYRLFAPFELEPNKQYPLVVYLHDAPAKGNDNKLQLEENYIIDVLRNTENVNIHSCYILVPQCPIDENWVNGIINTSTYAQALSPISRPLSMTMEIIAMLQENYKIDRQRIYIGGVGEGATGTWDLCTRYPDIFAAAFPAAGHTDPTTASAMAQIPTWAFHGQTDPVVSFTSTYNMVLELEKLQGDIQFTKYRHVDHEINERVSKEPDLFWWLFSQKKADKSLFASVTDCKEQDAYYTNIRYVVEHDFLPVREGTNCFGPDEPATISDAVTGLLTCMGFEYKGAERTGYANNSYFTKAKQLEVIMPGFDFTTTSAPLSKELLASIIGRIYALKADNNYYVYQPIFHDYEEIAGRYRDMAVKAYSKGLFDLSPAFEFEPQAVVTRAQLAQVIHRICQPNVRVEPEGLKRKFDGKTEKYLTTIGPYDTSNNYFDNPGFIVTRLAMGNLAADSVRNETEAEISIIAESEVQGLLEFGDVTTRDIASVYRTSSNIIMIKVNGAQLMHLLNLGMDGYNGEQILSVSGVKGLYDASLKKGERILYPRMESLPIEKERSYTLAISEDILKAFDFLENYEKVDLFPDIIQLTIELVGELGISRPGIEDPRIRIKEN